MSHIPHRLQEDYLLASSSQQRNHDPLPNHFQNNQQYIQNHENHNAQQGLSTKHSKMLHKRPQKRTSIWARCMAAVCIIFWVLVILLGLAVLIIYLAYRPRNPQLDITSATLNAGYIDTGNLLNADVTLLANVINPNTKVNIYFSYLQLDMYFQGIMIGTQVIDAFYEPRGTMTLRYVHIVTSAVALPLQVAQEWGNGTQAGGGGVTLHVSGKFRTRWLFGRWLRFTNWLDPACEILVGPPPNGAILRKQC